MILAIIILSMVVGLLRGGKILNISNLKMKFIPLMVISFLMQLAILYGYKYNIVVIKNYDILLYFVSYILLFAALMNNFSNKWFIILTLGVVCNFLVIFLNGGKMPVSMDAASMIGMQETIDTFLAMKAGTHQILTKNMLLWFLADIIPISLPAFLSRFNNILSIGDLIIFIGLFGVLQSAMCMKETKYEIDEYTYDIGVSEKAISDNNMPQITTMNEILNNNNSNEMIEVDDSEEAIALKTELIETTEDIINNDDHSIRENVIKTTDIETTDIEIENELKEQNEVFISYLDKINSFKETKEDVISNENVVNNDIETINNDNNTDSSKNEDMDIINENNETNFDFPNFLSENNEVDNNLFEEKPISENFECNEFEDLQTENEVINSIDEEAVKDECIDTKHEFIIENGRIIKNPNYGKKNIIETNGIIKDDSNEIIDNQEQHQDLQTSNSIDDIIDKLDDHVQELKLDTIDMTEDEKDIFDATDDMNILQRVTDKERKELMKKMKERRELGYDLVQLKVGEKEVNFWKKEI